MKIYSDKPDVYIKRLADLIFGTEIRTASGNVKNSLDTLDSTRLNSFISKKPKLNYQKLISVANENIFFLNFSSRFEAVRKESKPGTSQSYFD